jgi:hypothetical protein
MIREFKHDDLSRIESIARSKDFDLPARTNVVTESVIENNSGRIIAYGMVKAYAEAVLFIDDSISVKDKASSLSQLMRQAIYGSHLAGFDQVHGFFKDPKFAEVMKKHYGFKEPNGSCLYLEID